RKIIALRDLHLDAEILLFVDEQRLRKTKCCYRRWLAVGDDFAAFGIGAGTAWKKPGRHLDHDLFTAIEGSNCVEAQSADEVPSAVVRTNLRERRLLAVGYLIRVSNVILEVVYRKGKRIAQIGCITDLVVGEFEAACVQCDIIVVQWQLSS